MSMRAPRLGQKQIVEDAGAGREKTKKARSEQHGGDPGVGPHGAIESRAHQKASGKQAETEKSAAIHAEMAECQPQAVDGGQASQQRKEQDGQSGAS
jgi:hypothetical protein